MSYLTFLYTNYPLQEQDQIVMRNATFLKIKTPSPKTSPFFFPQTISGCLRNNKKPSSKHTPPQRLD
jgi:hypothetical protein